MASRVRTIVEFIEIETVVPFDLQKALLQKEIVISGDFSHADKIQLELLPKPVIINGIAYIFMAHAPYFEEVTGYRPLYTEKGISHLLPDDFSLHLLIKTIERHEYETT